jgi:cytochrome c553
MKRVLIWFVGLYLTVLVLSPAAQPAFDGKQIFRFDTFGDEQLWTDTLQLHKAVSTLSPAAALNAGLKVDVEALPATVVNALEAGTVNLKDPAVTLQLLAANAVVGVIGQVRNGSLDSVGTTCALCHSTVDNSLTAGIGRRLDGWPNRDLNVGAIIALSPVIASNPTAVATYTSWGRGKYDPRLQAFDGTGFIELNRSTMPVVIPPAYGLRLVEFETFTGDGPISYWNSYVAVSQMGGQGSFHDPRIGLSITQTPDLVTPKLPALLQYQLSLRAPDPPRGSFNIVAAQRGRQLFNGAARCDTCHTPPAFTDVLRGRDRSVPFLHAPSETGMEPVYASRTATSRYRTTPLRGVWQHPPYFHDGSAADLLAVVNHYDKVLSLGLSAAQKTDLVEYLKSL